MKNVRFLFLILALILVVGMTTGLIVRKQTGGQTVMQHSGAPAPVSTTPATTGDDEPAAPEATAQVSKIMLLVEHDDDYSVTVTEDNVDLEPIDTVYYPSEANSGEKGGPGSSVYYAICVDRYLVDPSCTSVSVTQSSKADVQDIAYLWFCHWDDHYATYSVEHRLITDLNSPYVLYSEYVFAFLSFDNSISIQY